MVSFSANLGLLLKVGGLGDFDVKDDWPDDGLFLPCGALPQREQIVITRHGKPAGVLLGFADEEAWFDYRLENDPWFLQRIAAARESLRAGQGGAFGGCLPQQIQQAKAAKTLLNFLKRQSQQCN